MSYRIVATAGQKISVVVAQSVVEALRVVQTYGGDRRLKVTIAAEGWMLTPEELEELAKP